jgi:transposase
MNFIGCDVSKQKLDCALLCASDKFLHKTVPNSAAGVQELLAWVAKKAAFAPDALHVVLEATGPYHEMAAKAFFDAGFRVSVVNPAYPKHYAQSLGLKSKTDRADAVILARYGQATSGLRRWQPPAPCYRQLQESIPGVGAAVARVLLPILQPGRFDSAPQAAAYLGLVPIERQSGTSVKGRPRQSKAGDSRARATLYLPALVAARCNPHIRALYERLIANGKCKMAALGACRHVSCYISVLAF